MIAEPAFSARRDGGAIRILHLEDNEHDRELIRGNLAGSGIACEFTYAATRQEFETEMMRLPLDLILADVSLPDYDGRAGLKLAQASRPEVPYIFVSGTIGEEQAIEALRLGATDYVLKGNLSRLASAVERAVREAAKENLRVSAGRALDHALHFAETTSSHLARTAEALRSSDERYRLLFEANPIPMWVYDMETLRFLAVNNAAIRTYGYSRQEFLDLTILDIRPAESVPAFIEFLRNDSRPPFKKSGVSTHQKKDGSRIRAEITAHELVFDGRRSRLVLATDVTLREKATEELAALHADLEERVRERTARLEAAREELEAFSYSVSHDLRSPLRGIAGFTRSLLDDYGKSLDPEGLRRLRTIGDEANRMGHLIDDLLAFSRAGRQELNCGEIDMSSLARSAFQILQEENPGHKASLDVTALPAARGDRALIRQVFANLLGNAIKFSARTPEPKIEVGGKADDEETAVYWIKDNGVGFDVANKHRLFGVFQRLHSASEFEGTGVGLALVKRIVQRHNGRVWAESPPGSGAIFYFSLPVQKPPKP